MGKRKTIAFAPYIANLTLKILNEVSYRLQILGIGVVCLGLVFMLIFHCGVREPRIDDFTARNELEESHEAKENNKTVACWFKTPLFYQVTCQTLIHWMIQPFSLHFVLNRPLEILG